jgi:hypothetical protein
MESPNPDQKFLDEFVKICLGNLTQLKEYKISSELEWNNSKQLTTLRNSVQPLDELGSNLENYTSYSKNARTYKYISWALFLMGFLIFYFYFLKYLFDKGEHHESK